MRGTTCDKVTLTSERGTQSLLLLYSRNICMYVPVHRRWSLVEDGRPSRTPETSSFVYIMLKLHGLKFLLGHRCAGDAGVPSVRGSLL